MNYYDQNVRESVGISAQINLLDTDLEHVVTKRMTGVGLEKGRTWNAVSDA